ncbi:MAG: hypothetical protein Q7R70_05660 [Candidatus Diapherotrites archaeon]|nr:hypothetical protein [Candidatus Diapherotrites archaeon]
MDSKGFTLFTALVSFVLITLAFVLVQSMIESERNSSQTIETIDEQTEMQNIADLARADALQLFNIGVRYQFEKWITDPTNEFYVMDRTSASNWNQMVSDFAKAELGGKEIQSADGATTTSTEQFANAMSDYLVGIISRGSGTYAFKGYDVQLVINEDNPNDTSKFKTAIKVMADAGIANNTLLEPIKCSDSSCDIGTFYINLNLTSLTPQQYNQLPQIVVKSQATGRVIKQPILPKGNLRIYAPLRIFKALWKAKKIANENVFASSNQFNEIGLGMCDSDCSIRQSPNSQGIAINQSNFPGPDGKGYLCPNTKGAAAASHSLEEVALNCSPASACPATYNTGSSNEMANALRQYITATGATTFHVENSDSIDPTPTDGLKLWPDGIPAGSIVKGGTKTIETKEIFIANSQDTGKGICVRSSGIEVILIFNETLSQFKVNQARGSDKVYKIKISDSYSTASQATLAKCNSVIASSGGVLPMPGDETYSCENG